MHELDLELEVCMTYALMDLPTCVMDLPTCVVNIVSVASHLTSSCTCFGLFFLPSFVRLLL